MDNPKMHYSINQILMATKGLFLTPIKMWNGYRYYMSHYCARITKFTEEEYNRIEQRNNNEI